jgi:hypothetical protein
MLCATNAFAQKVVDSIFTPGTSTQEMLKKLNAFEEPLYLTGSRSLGLNRDGSDWDFFAQYSSPLSHKLQAIGFERKKDESYDDPSLINCLTYVRCSPSIDVQLISPAYIAKKQTAQMVLQQMFSLFGSGVRRPASIHFDMTKVNMFAWWKMMMQ